MATALLSLDLRRDLAHVAETVDDENYKENHTQADDAPNPGISPEPGLVGDGIAAGQGEVLIALDVTAILLRYLAVGVVLAVLSTAALVDAVAGEKARAAVHQCGGGVQVSGILLALFNALRPPALQRAL